MEVADTETDSYVGRFEDVVHHQQQSEWTACIASLGGAIHYVSEGCSLTVALGSGGQGT
jgi:hypothetical protein